VPKFSPFWESVFFSPWLAGALLALAAALALVAAAYIWARKDFVLANPIRPLASVAWFAVALFAIYLVQLIGERNVLHEVNANRLALETKRTI
jgi:hypothetical protein